MAEGEPRQIGLNRDAVGRGWTDILDNQIAIMQALLLVSDLQKEKAYDTNQALRYRIAQTIQFLHATPPSS